MSFFYISNTLLTTTAEGWACWALYQNNSGVTMKPCQVPRSRYILGRATKTHVCCVHKSQGLIFVGSWLPSEGEEWKNEAGLKQIAASGETCGLRLNRAINQRTDREGGRERERERERQRKREGKRESKTKSETTTA